MTSAVTRRFTFRSVHSLPGLNEAHHGHQYFLEIAVRGGVDIGGLERLVRENILLRLDRHNLNPLMSAATGEQLVEWIHQTLLGTAIGDALVGVALQETRKNRFVSAASSHLWA